MHDNDGIYQPENSMRSPINENSYTAIENLFAPGGFAHESALPVLALNADAVVLGLNKTYADICLESIETLQGQCIYQFITEDQIAEVKPLIEKAFQDQKCFSYALHSSRDIGDDIFLEWDATPLFHDGKMVALFWVGHDVTYARKTELEYKHLYQIAQAINASTKLDDILLMVRNALKEVSGFDRVGVWLAQGEQLIGAWGTNLDCSIADERDRRVRLSEFIPEVYTKIQNNELFGTLALTQWVMQDSSVVTTEKPLDFAFMTLRVQGELVGIMFADNYPTQRGLVLDEVARLLPLGEQCATAIRTVRLTEERNHFIESRRNLIQVYAEITQAATFDETLRKVRAAIVRTGLFDRAGVYYVQGDRCHSAWGTSIQGQEVDEHGTHYSPESYDSMMAYLRQSGTNYCMWEAAPEEEVPSTATLPYTHGLSALEVGDDVLGLIFVDNFIL